MTLAGNPRAKIVMCDGIDDNGKDGGGHFEFSHVSREQIEIARYIVPYHWSNSRMLIEKLFLLVLD